MVLAFVPAAIVGLGFFLNRNPYGLAIRACAENGDAAQLAASRSGGSRPSCGSSPASWPR